MIFQLRYALLKLVSQSRDAQVLSQKLDPGGVSNYTVTFVDWTERKWHPKAYSVDNTTSLLLRQIKCEDRYIAWRPYWHRIRQSYKSHLVRGLPRFDGCCGAVRC
ncbi:unnamed protein product [Closterium sp. NIES-65]|nr:unnamed protein product [Closterium sp. NIES-65]